MQARSESRPHSMTAGQSQRSPLRSQNLCLPPPKPMQVAFRHGRLSRGDLCHRTLDLQSRLLRQSQCQSLFKHLPGHSRTATSSQHSLLFRRWNTTWHSLLVSPQLTHTEHPTMGTVLQLHLHTMTMRSFADLWILMISLLLWRMTADTAMSSTHGHMTMARELLTTTFRQSLKRARQQCWVLDH